MRGVGWNTVRTYVTHVHGTESELTTNIRSKRIEVEVVANRYTIQSYWQTQVMRPALWDDELVRATCNESNAIDYTSDNAKLAVSKG